MDVGRSRCLRTVRTHVLRVVTVVGIASAAIAASQTDSEPSAPQRADAPDTALAKELAHLIDLVARNAPGAEEAETELIQRVTRPFATALASQPDRPLEQRLRLDRTLRRARSALVIEVERARLDAADRARFDAVRARFPAEVHQLFHDEIHVRVAALSRLPIQADDAGLMLLLAMKLESDPELLSELIERVEALEHTRLLSPMVAMLIMRDVAALRELEVFGRDAPAYRIVYLNRISKLVRWLAPITAGAGATPRPGPPTSAGAVDLPRVVRETFGTLAGAEFDEYREFIDALAFAETSARFADRSALPLYAPYLADQRPHRPIRDETGTLHLVTVSDQTLLFMLQTLGETPEALGFEQVDARGRYAMRSDTARERAVAHMRQWLARYVDDADHPFEPLTPTSDLP